VFVPATAVQSGDDISTTIPDSSGSQRPNGLTVNFTGSSAGSHAELAFITNSETPFEKVDLAAALQSFNDYDQLDAPMLYSASSEIYMGVDLTTWLHADSAPAPGQLVPIVNGASDLLPGYVFSTAPVTFDPSSGWTTSTPFTGLLTVGGSYNVDVIPEPATALPALLALLMLGRSTSRPRDRFSLGKRKGDRRIKRDSSEFISHLLACL